MTSYTSGNFRFIWNDLTIDYLGNGITERAAFFVHGGNGYNLCFIEDVPFYIPREEFMSFAFRIQQMLDIRYDEENNLKQ